MSKTSRTRARFRLVVLLSWLPVIGIAWTTGAITEQPTVASTIAAIWTGVVLLVLIRTLETA